MTPDPARRRQRALASAQAQVQAGEFDAARGLLAIAEAGPLGEAGQAHAELVRAQLAYAAGKGNDAQPLLLTAARRLEPVDPRLARMTYLDAMRNAIYAGRLASPGADLSAVSRAAAAAPQPPGGPAPADRLLYGLTADFAQEYARGLPTLRKSLPASGSDLTADEEMRWVPLAAIAAAGVWDDEDWAGLTDRYVDLCRELGALTELRQALCLRAFMFLFTGELTAAESVIEEAQAAATAIGSDHAPYSPLGLAAFRGREAEVSVLARAAVEEAAAARRRMGDNRRGMGQRAGQQRPLPLPQGAGGRAAGNRVPGRSRFPDLGAGRAGRGGGAEQRRRNRGDRLQPARGDGRCQRHRLGARGQGQVTRAARRRR